MRTALAAAEPPDDGESIWHVIDGMEPGERRFAFGMVVTFLGEVKVPLDIQIEEPPTEGDR